MQNYCLFHKFHDQKDLSEQINQFLDEPSISCINIYSYKIDLLWEYFVEHFHFLEASGGIVLDKKSRLMLIKRNDRWDAPKGHFEPLETPEQCARREISEECGIKCGETLKALTPSYHIYKYDGEYYLKKTHWYLFALDGSDKSIPQTEEGISEASWIERESLHELTSTMWGSVRDVINEVLGSPDPYL